MTIRLVCVGKLAEPHFKAASAEYVKRISRYMPVEVLEVGDEPLAKRTERDVLRAEARRILSVLPKSSHVILLDRQGTQVTSEEFAQRVERLLIGGASNITFVVGGTLGVSDEVRAKADETVSFSQMTMAHQLARVVLLEQIYRAFTIIRGEKYHR